MFEFLNINDVNVYSTTNTGFLLLSLLHYVRSTEVFENCILLEVGEEGEHVLHVSKE